MILSQYKPMEEILEILKGCSKVFLLGCKGCAEASGTGGAIHVENLKNRLEEQGKEVTGLTSIDFLCQRALVKSRLVPLKGQVTAADAVLVLSCGIGVQASAASLKIPCYPGCNTISLGETRGMWPGQERCRECGDCVLDFTGGICPLTKCTKSLLNGACGGASRGKCEVAPERDCGWESIYYRLKELGQLDKLKTYLPPKDYGKMLTPDHLINSTFFDIEYKEEDERGAKT